MGDLRAQFEVASSMLKYFRIRDFAIIEDQTVSFGPGLNVISGETGAGKSIIMQALDLILGGRSQPQFTRQGSSGWQLEAVFDLTELPKEIFQLLPEIAQTEELVISREMKEGGKGKVFINGRLATVALLTEVSSKLISVCSQGNQIRLLEPAYHLELIDGFSGNQKVRVEYQKVYQRWSELRLQLEEARRASEKNSIRKAELSFVSEELGQVELYPGLRVELEEEIARLSNAENLIRLANDVSSALEDEDGILASLSSLDGHIRELRKIDSSKFSLFELFDTAGTELREFSADLQHYAAGIELNAEGLEKLRDQLAEVARLERKYSCDTGGLVDLKISTERELAQLAEAPETEKLADELRGIEADLKVKAEALTSSRVSAARKLARQVEKELAELSMPSVKISFEVGKKDYSVDGVDALEVLIATNKGEIPRPLRAIASGGELARITLVLKKVLRDRSGVNVLVFDEVDTGISGKVARAVGEKLKGLAEHSQVLCITHLAQVASLSDRHYLVRKLDGKRTVSVIEELGDEEKIDEIARMLAGYRITAASRESARELLSSTEEQ